MELLNTTNIKLNSTIKAKLTSTFESINVKIPLLLEILKDKPQDKIYSDLMINFNIMEFRIIILMKLYHFFKNTKITLTIRL